MKRARLHSLAPATFLLVVLAIPLDAISEDVTNKIHRMNPRWISYSYDSDDNLVIIGKYDSYYKTIKPATVFLDELRGYWAIPDTIEGDPVVKIGENAFRGCDYLRGIQIPDSVREIDSGAFGDCKVLREIRLPKKLKTIHQHAFTGCPMLKKIIIPEGVEDFTSFADFPMGIHYDVAPGNKRYCSEDGILFSKDKSELLSFPSKTTGEYTIPASVTNIGKKAFEFSSLSSVIIPNGVRTVPPECFEFSKSLSSIVLPDGLLEVGDNAFSGCASLTSVSLPNSVTNIKSWAFDDCKALSSIVLPDGLLKVENRAFFGCNNLASVYVSPTVNKIGSGAFSCCNSLTTLIISNPETEIEDYSFDGLKKLSLVAYPNGQVYDGDPRPFRGTPAYERIIAVRKLNPDTAKKDELMIKEEEQKRVEAVFGTLINAAAAFAGSQEGQQLMERLRQEQAAQQMEERRRQEHREVVNAIRDNTAAQQRAAAASAAAAAAAAAAAQGGGAGSGSWKPCPWCGGTGSPYPNAMNPPPCIKCNGFGKLRE